MPGPAPLPPAPDPSREIIPYVSAQHGFIRSSESLGCLLVEAAGLAFVAPRDLAELMESEAQTFRLQFQAQYRSARLWRPRLARVDWSEYAWQRYLNQPLAQAVVEDRGDLFLSQDEILHIDVTLHEEDTLILDAIRVQRRRGKEVRFLLRCGNGELASRTLQRFFAGRVSVDYGANDG